MHSTPRNALNARKANSTQAKRELGQWEEASQSALAVCAAKGQASETTGKLSEVKASLRRVAIVVVAQLLLPPPLLLLLLFNFVVRQFARLLVCSFDRTFVRSHVRVFVCSYVRLVRLFALFRRGWRRFQWGKWAGKFSWHSALCDIRRESGSKPKHSAITTTTTTTNGKSFAPVGSAHEMTSKI